MSDSVPHYVLYSTMTGGDCPRWRFELRTTDGAARLVAEDFEPAAQGERLELMAVVRGLEALEQPSRVTLLTPSGYVRQGLRYGLREWRDNGWRWEFFGQMVPVKHSDLWQRIDAALRFHRVECRAWRRDTAHEGPPRPMPELLTAIPASRVHRYGRKRRHSRPMAWWRRAWGTLRSLFRRMAGDRVTLVPTA